MTAIEQLPQVYCPSLHLLSEEELNRLSIYRVHNKDKKYRYTHSNELVSIRPFLQEEDAWIVLYFIGEHVSVRYSQLLYFMKKRIKRQAMSRILKTLDYYQLIQKWQIQLRNDEDTKGTESYKESAFTITEYGFQLLKYWCGQKYFYHPNNFEKHGKYVHLRYWQDIDMLCHLRNKTVFQDHIMHAKLTSGLLPSSFSFRVKQHEKKEINFIVYSIIDSENLSRIQSIMRAWDQFVKSGKNLVVLDYPVNPTVLVIYVPTIKKAKYLNRELMLDLKTVNIRLCIGEVLHEQGLNNAFFDPLAEGELKQIHIPLFD